MFVPSLLLKKLYTIGSLSNRNGGVSFALKNRLSDAAITRIRSISIDDEPLDIAEIALSAGDGIVRTAHSVSDDAPLDFPLGQVVHLSTASGSLDKGTHQIEIAVDSKPFGMLKFDVTDAIAEDAERLVKIPRDDTDDYSDDIIRQRQRFLEEFSDTKLDHIRAYSFDPHVVQGNCEHFTGVAQIPIGIAGPIRINGEHASGDFLIPLATTEGTLIASYNRGMKVLNLCGGATCTVVGDAMQRAPVFVFDDARGARDFVAWVKDHMDTIRETAEATSSIAKLQYVDSYLSNKFAYLRFNYSTGDAAGQNMVGRATFAACSWIVDHYEGIRHFYLESNFATDKKASQINIMRTRGKRVTAEAVVTRDVLMQQMRVDPDTLDFHMSVSSVGAFLSGANNNGAHSANGITAMFIATGQDVANVSESSAGIMYTELTPGGDLYISATVPSLIVATHGGGTSLPTQRECLNLLGCVGRGTVNKLAEIVAGVVLAGELSLASAISSSDWVSSHERYGRNR